VIASWQGPGDLRRRGHEGAGQAGQAARRHIPGAAHTYPTAPSCKPSYHSRRRHRRRHRHGQVFTQTGFCIGYTIFIARNIDSFMPSDIQNLHLLSVTTLLFFFFFFFSIFLCCFFCERPPVAPLALCSFTITITSFYRRG